MSVRRWKFGQFALCMALMLIAVACGGSNAQTTTTGSQTSGRVVQLTLTDKMTFDPPTFTLKTNERVTVELRNAGALKHNFAIDSLHINNDVAPGATVQIALTAPDRPGQLAFYCNVPGHSEAGMVGTLVIEQ